MARFPTSLAVNRVPCAQTQFDTNYKYVKADLMKPCPLISCLLDVAKAVMVADLCLKGVCLTSVLLHCSSYCTTNVNVTGMN